MSTGPLSQAFLTAAGRHFDPEILEPFLFSMDEVLEIWQRYSDERIAGSRAAPRDRLSLDR